MLTRWLTLTAFLAGLVITPGAASSQRAVTFAPTCRVKAHPEVELTLNCGDQESAGDIQYWHTPFGDLLTPGFHTKLDPVFMHHDGSLVIPNSTVLHSGLYYCLLQHMDGATLWQYELHVDPNNRNHHEHDTCKQSTSCAAVRFKRSSGPAEKQATVSDGLFAGAVAASVLLTFVVGFSAGALSRTHVLRCFGAVTMKLQSPKRQPRRTDMPDHSSQITITTITSTLHRQAFESEGDSAKCATMEMTTLTSLCPPAKPQRSFRHKREEEEATAYLEGCDHVKEKSEVLGGGVKEIKEVCDGEPKKKEREFNGVHLLEDEGNQTETDEDKHSKERQEEDGESTEGKMDGRVAEEAGELESLSTDDGETVRRDRDLEKTEEVKENKISAELEQPSTETDERSSKNEETGSDDITGDSSAAPIRGRRSRVIRLYQYDEDGQRFCHLPDTTPEDQGPTPTLKQRSISLTRLSAIMAAASAGPLDQKETDVPESEERLQFHMEI